MADSTNVPRDNLVLEDNKEVINRRESKQLSQRSMKKGHGHKEIGPSSKSISEVGE